jgi:hypothetical protein
MAALKLAFLYPFGYPTPYAYDGIQGHKKQVKLLLKNKNNGNCMNNNNDLVIKK